MAAFTAKHNPCPIMALAGPIRAKSDTARPVDAFSAPAAARKYEQGSDCPQLGDASIWLPRSARFPPLDTSETFTHKFFEEAYIFTNA